MWIPVRRPWHEKPPPGTRIDRGKSINDGMIAAWILDDAGLMIDCLGNHHGDPSGNPQLIGSPQGSAIEFDGVGDFFTVPASDDFHIPSGESATWIVGVTMRELGGGEIFECQDTTPVIQLRNLTTPAGALQWFLKSDSSVFAQCDTDAALTLGSYYNIACTKDAANEAAIYVDAVKQSDTATLASFGACTPDVDLLIASGNAADAQTDEHYLFAYSTLKTPDELSALNLNPWMGFEDSLVWVNVGADAGTTETPPAGTWAAWIGQTVDDIEATNIQPPAGTWAAWIGQTVDDVEATNIQPPAGTWAAWQGQAITVTGDEIATGYRRPFPQPHGVVVPR